MRDGTKVGLAAGVAILAVVGISVGVYATDAATSGVRGGVELHKQNEDAGNRVSAIDQWTTNHKDVQDAIKALQIQGKVTDDGKNDPQQFYQTALTSCNDAVNTYDQLQSQSLVRDWKPTEYKLSYVGDTVCTDTFDITTLDQ